MYVKRVWADGPTGGTPIDSTSLNNIEDGIFVLYNNWVFKGFGDADDLSVYDRVAVVTTGGPVTLTTPSSPSIGDRIYFADVSGNFSINNLTIQVPTGGYFMGVLDDFLVLESDYDFVELVYLGDNTENGGYGNIGWYIAHKP